MTAQRREPRQRIEVAADAKAAIADKIAFAIVQWQTGQLYRQPAAAVDRPVKGNAAPGVVGGDSLEYAAVGIEPEGFGDNISCIVIKIAAAASP